MRFIVAISILSLFMFDQKAYAQGHSLYCSHAESTAESQACLQRHLDAAQERLNGVYQDLTQILTGEALDTLKTLQNDWLAYRDSECLWEASLSDNPSLKRANELSCLARVTDDRADMLYVALQDEKNAEGQQETQREYGSFPRWMNVVSKKAPQAAWHYKDRTRFDLDCDGEDEFIMSGVSLALSDTPPLYAARYLISITDNPPVGKPLAQIIELPIGSESNAQEHQICSSSPDIDFVDGAPSQKPDNDEQQPSCQAKLVLRSKNCPDQVVYWLGAEYALEKQAQILQKDQNKKETKDNKQ